jgi:hypothetical protein
MERLVREGSAASSTRGFLAALMLSLSAPALAADSVKINDLSSPVRSRRRNAMRPSKPSAPSTISGTPATKPC